MDDRFERPPIHEMEPDNQQLDHAPSALISAVFSMDRLQNTWRELNEKYFHGRLRPISIVWSRRLTASVGMFVSHMGPRVPHMHSAERRLIRLSIPLLKDQCESELIGTLAHEMIHQWQYDILKRRPDHGPEFHRMMAVMNRDGLGITIRHSLEKAVHALTKYTWRCINCGRDYHRQRKTIRPSRHRCGQCLGKLRELPPASISFLTTSLTDLEPTTMPPAPPTVIGASKLFTQMFLPFANH
jgi:predicted SprT family Zn-dependent metalloprotease